VEGNVRDEDRASPVAVVDVVLTDALGDVVVGVDEVAVEPRVGERLRVDQFSEVVPVATSRDWNPREPGVSLSRPRQDVRRAPRRAVRSSASWSRRK
jgi:hypothetical protein